MTTHSCTHHLKEAANKLGAHTDVPSKMLMPLFIIDAYGSRSYFVAALGWFALIVAVEPLRDVLASLWLAFRAWLVQDSVAASERYYAAEERRKAATKEQMSTVMSAINAERVELKKKQDEVVEEKKENKAE